MAAFVLGPMEKVAWGSISWYCPRPLLRQVRDKCVCEFWEVKNSPNIWKLKNGRTKLEALYSTGDVHGLCHVLHAGNDTLEL